MTKSNFKVRYLGAMIAKRWLLTSGSFLSFDRPEDVFVHPLDDTEIFDYEPYQATKIVLPSDFHLQPYWRENNVALVRLDRALDGDTTYNTLCFNEFPSKDLNLSEYFAVSLPWQRPIDAPSMGAKIFPVCPLTLVYANFFETMSNFTEVQRSGDPLIGIYRDPVHNVTRQILVGLYESHVTKVGNQTVSKYVRLSRLTDWIYKSLFEKTRDYKSKNLIITISRAELTVNSQIMVILVFSLLLIV